MTPKAKRNLDLFLCFIGLLMGIYGGASIMHDATSYYKHGQLPFLPTHMIAISDHGDKAFCSIQIKKD